jgi:hypothetical protein
MHISVLASYTMNSKAIPSYTMQIGGEKTDPITIDGEVLQALYQSLGFVLSRSGERALINRHVEAERAACVSGLEARQAGHAEHVEYVRQDIRDAGFNQVEHKRCQCMGHCVHVDM